MQDGRGQVACERSHRHGSSGRQLPRKVVLERGQIDGEHRVGDAERATDGPRLGVEDLGPGPRDRLEPRVRRHERRVDERRMDPQ
jgi:hypothetical protein